MADTDTETKIPSDDPDGWTVQDPWAPPAEADRSLEPTQYHPGQLPDPAAAESAGVPVLTIPEAQVSDDAADHPNGPEPGEVAVLEAREAAGVGAEALEPDIDMEAPTASEAGEEVDLSTMTKAQIQEWADASGYEGLVDKNTMSKDEMIEALTS